MANDDCSNKELGRFIVVLVINKRAKILLKGSVPYLYLKVSNQICYSSWEKDRHKSHELRARDSSHHAFAQ